MLLDKFWRLLEFNPDAGKNADDELLSEGGARASRLGSAASHVADDPEPLSPEELFANLLRHKFQLFKHLSLELLNESDKVLSFTLEEVKRIADYAKTSYFKHLRLYDYVLNNKQLCEVKRITMQLNQPAIATHLNDALLLGSEETLGYEDEDEELRLEIVRQKAEIGEERRREEEKRLRLEME